MRRFQRWRGALCGAVFLVAGMAVSAADGRFHYFDPDHQVTFSGRLAAFRIEPMYAGRTPFIILTVESEGRTMRVEVAPRWFFRLDLAVGMQVRVTGSGIDRPDAPAWIIARELVIQGQRYELRDAHGFPLWSRRGAGHGSEARRGGNCRGWGGGV